MSSPSRVTATPLSQHGRQRARDICKDVHAALEAIDRREEGNGTIQAADIVIDFIQQYRQAKRPDGPLPAAPNFGAVTIRDDHAVDTAGEDNDPHKASEDSKSRQTRSRSARRLAPGDKTYSSRLSYREASSSKDTTSASEPDVAVDADSALAPLTLGLRSDLAPPAMITVREQLVDYLQKTQVSARINNKPAVVSFSFEQIAKVMDIVFVQMLGKPAVHQISRIIDAHSASREDGTSAMTAQLALDIAINETVPESLRSLSAAYSTQAKPKSNDFQAFMERVDGLQLLKRYAQVRQPAAQEEVTRFLNANGFHTSQGVSYSTLVNLWFAQELKLTGPNDFSNRCQKWACFARFTQVFGDGILLLLPNEAVHHFNRYGVQRMEILYRGLSEVFPQLAEVVEVLTRTIYQPILNGQPVELVKPRKSANLLESLETATMEKVAEEA